MTPEETAKCYIGYTIGPENVDGLAADLRDYGEQCRRAALEEACRVVCLWCDPGDDGSVVVVCDDKGDRWHTGGNYCSASPIRRLMEVPDAG